MQDVKSNNKKLSEEEAQKLDNTVASVDEIAKANTKRYSDWTRLVQTNVKTTLFVVIDEVYHSGIRKQAI